MVAFCAADTRSLLRSPRGAYTWSHQKERASEVPTRRSLKSAAKGPARRSRPHLIRGHLSDIAVGVRPGLVSHSRLDLPGCSLSRVPLSRLLARSHTTPLLAPPSLSTPTSISSTTATVDRPSPLIYRRKRAGSLPVGLISLAWAMDSTHPSITWLE